MVCAGCVFVAGIHKSRTWTSGSFESVRWNACVHRLDLGLYSLSPERVFRGMEFEPMLTPREKSPLPENVPRGGSNPRRCGQRAQALPTSYSGPSMVLITVITFFTVTGSHSKALCSQKYQLCLFTSNITDSHHVACHKMVPSFRNDIYAYNTHPLLIQYS